MKTIISYSGGLGSFTAAYDALWASNDVELVFCDTLTEDIDLYRFLEETVRFLKVPFTRIADGRNIWQVQYDVKYQANSRIDPCSRVLKRELFKKYMRDNHTPETAEIVIGIDHTEAHRRGDFEVNHAPFTVRFPLCDRRYDREHILDVLDKAGIRPPRLYDLDFPHNNCGGFCVKAGQRQAKLLLDKLPETYAWHEKQQEAVITLMGKKHGTIRKMVDGVTHYLTLREFREMVERGETIEKYVEGNCACF